jgi:hypothetical protein
VRLLLWVRVVLCDWFFTGELLADDASRKGLKLLGESAGLKWTLCGRGLFGVVGICCEVRVRGFDAT